MCCRQNTCIRRPKTCGQRLRMLHCWRGSLRCQINLTPAHLGGGGLYRLQHETESRCCCCCCCCCCYTKAPLSPPVPASMALRRMKLPHLANSTQSSQEGKRAKNSRWRAPGPCPCPPPLPGEQSLTDAVASSATSTRGCLRRARATHRSWRCPTLKLSPPSDTAASRPPGGRESR